MRCTVAMIRIKEICHPDETEKKKHFIGQADTHRQIGLKQKSKRAESVMS
jgi:ERCC4-related helicase